MKISVVLKTALMISLSLLPLLTLTSCQKESLSEKEFPLKINLNQNTFVLGEKIFFTAKITNRSGKDVDIATNGEMPCFFFRADSGSTIHGVKTVLISQILKANETMDRTFLYTPFAAGTYILDVHYRIEVSVK